MRFLPSRNKARREFGQIANEYDLVYFGQVDPKIDTDYKMVKGLTASPLVRDENYTTGNVYDYEIAFLQRSRRIKTLHGEKTMRHWTILQVQLKKGHFPHFLIEGRRRAEEYGALLASTKRWREIGWQHIAAEVSFPRTFATFARPMDVASISAILTQEVQSMLTAHFAQFDYEIENDKLIVYAINIEVDLQLLDHMLRVGLWLARRLDGATQHIVSK